MNPTAAVTSREIVFANQHSATVVQHTPQADMKDVIRELNLRAFEGVIIIVGGATKFDDAQKDSRLDQLFNRGIMRAALESNALLIDGGTDSGVMGMLGRSLASRQDRPALIGVAPEGKIALPGDKSGDPSRHALEPNHSHFVLAAGDSWDNSTILMFRLAEQLGDDKQVLVVLVNGGATSQDCILQAVRRKWHILTVDGSGRLADTIAADIRRIRSTAPGTAEVFVEDPDLAEILRDGDIEIVKLDDGLEATIEHIRGQITHSLLSDNYLLRAWRRYAVYDENAQLQQRQFRRLETWILKLSVFSTLLAIGKVVLEREVLLLQIPGTGSWITSLADRETLLPLLTFLHEDLLHWSVVLVPILITALLTAANHFKHGKKWINLRANAESIKSEIFMYRSLAGIYGWDQEEDLPRQSQLALKLKAITRQTMLTEVNRTALQPVEEVAGVEVVSRIKGRHPEDQLINLLTPDEYIKLRIEDQVSFFVSKAVKLEKTLKFRQYAIFFFAGFGTLLAAFGFEIWIALTSAIGVALATMLQFDQVEETLTIYNQAATDLENVKEWWEALSPLQKKQRRNFNKMVKTTEAILESETRGWAQNMSDALQKLRDTQRDDGFMGSLEHAVENYKDKRARGNMINNMAELIKAIPDNKARQEIAGAMKDALDGAAGS